VDLLVLLVLGWSAVAEIHGAVVERVSVKVAYLHAGRTWANERLRHELVHIRMATLTALAAARECHLFIATAADLWFQDYATGAAPIFQCAVKRSDTAQV